jgi:hypothetical protein
MRKQLTIIGEWVNVCYHSWVKSSCGGEVSKTRLIFERYWSLAVALLLPVMEIVAESSIRLGEYNEVLRAILSIVCLALLVHSWLMQRRCTQSRWRLAFWTLLLSLVVLGPLWLGFNVIRFYSYDLQWKSTLWYHKVYWYVVELQDAIILLAEILGIVIVSWVVVALSRWLVNRIRSLK